MMGALLEGGEARALLGEQLEGQMKLYVKQGPFFVQVAVSPQVIQCLVPHAGPVTSSH